jgi:hypothetical protein
MAFVSSSSGFVIVDSRSNSGTITLPSASTLVGRSLIFKDGFNSFGTSTLTLSTTGIDTFDNLTSSFTVGETNGFVNLVAGSNKWHIVSGTRLTNQNVNNMIVSSINGISTEGFISSIPQNIITSSITLSSITFISYSSFYTQYGYGDIIYDSTSGTNISSFSTFTSPFTILKSTIAETLILTSTTITINGAPYSPPYFQTSVLDLNYTVSTTIVPFYTYSNSVVTTIAYGNDQWVAGSIGPQGTDNRPSIWNNSNQWTTNVDNPNTPLNQLSYNNNQWLGLGDNFILAGYDSYNLQTISFSIPIEFKTVAYNGKFWLAGGHTECNIGSIQISADGFNWYAQSNPLLRINGIAYGKNSYDSNLWVALGEPGTYIYTSFDGSNWTSQANSFQQGNTIRYGSNLWLAGGVNQTTPVNSIETSTDGSNWTERSNYLSIVNAFAYNDGKWVATGKHVSSLINGIETSVDGINWTTVSSMITVGKTVAYANGMWIAGGHKLNSTAIIEYSLDGTTWNSNINYFHTYSTILTTQSNKLLVNNEPIIGDNIKLSSLITNNVGLLYNYIGNNYRENVYTGGSNYSNVNAILYAKNLLIVGIAGEETGSATIDSKDSIQILNNNNWIQQSNNFSIVNGIDYNDGIWIAVGNNTGGATPSGIQISFNGSNWMQVGNSGYKTSPVFCVKYGNGLWLVGYSGNGGAPPSIRATYDGYNWYMQSNQMDAVRKIDYGNSLWVAVGDSVELGSTIQTSVDGSNWTLQSNSLQAAYSIKYANSLWVAGGINTALCNDTTIQISPDAITWEPRSNYLNQVNDIAYNDGIWLSVGCNTTNSNQCIQTSPDGSNWTVQTASYLKYGQSIGYSNGVWMVGGNTEVLGDYGNPKTVGLIEYSYDTVNWTSSFITSTIKSASTVLTGLSNSLFLNGVALSTTGNLQLPDLTSSIRGLGTVGYLSSGVQALDLASTVQGIQSLGYVSSAVQPPDLTSTIEGLGTFGYLSTGIQKVDLTSSIQGLGTTGFLSSPTRYITDSFCVAGGQNSNGEYCLQASYDGFTWINASNQPFGTSNSGQVNGVSFNGSYWVASGNGNCSIAVSYDGFNWIASSNDPFGSNGVARASAWNGSYWVVVGNSTDSSVTAGISYDGLNWTSSITNHLSNGGGTGIAWNGYIWVGTGSNYLTSNGVVSTNTTASIVISSDGMNWVKASTDVFVADIPYSAEATGIAWNGSYWVAVGRAQALGSELTVGISSDGYNWVSSLNNPFSAPGGGGATVPHGNKIAWNGSKWLAVGITASNEYSMAESTNGYNWTYPSSNPFIDGACTDVTWNGSYWITCSDNSKIATSPNAINWTVQPTSITGAARYGIASRIVLPYIGKNIVPAATTSLYIPSNPAIWDSPPPSTIQKAIDRLASFLSAFTTSNIPI